MRRTLLTICALTVATALPFTAPTRGTELLGYLENWVDGDDTLPDPPCSLPAVLTLLDPHWILTLLFSQ